jgi:hypothetical protein
LSQHATDSLDCATCHNDDKGGNYFVSSVIFPNGASANFASAPANLCLNCHQGRESTVSVDAAIKAAKVPDNKIAPKDPKDPTGKKQTLNFLNPHYFTAGASIFGSYVQGMYQFKGQKYSGISSHLENTSDCIACHNQHSLKVKYSKCAECHETTVTKVADALKLRSVGDSVDTNDYDGDGNAVEGIGLELEGMAGKLYSAIQAYAAKNANTEKGIYGVVYSDSYPYFLNDLNGNGLADTAEVDRANGFNAWTPNLLRAAYNYQWWVKDPGLFAHNFKYAGQVIYDSIKAVRGSVDGMVRPEVPAVLKPMPDKPVKPAS